MFYQADFFFISVILPQKDLFFTHSGNLFINLLGHLVYHIFAYNFGTSSFVFTLTLPILCACLIPQVLTASVVGDYNFVLWSVMSGEI